jgi:hypothetical protein
MTPRHSGPCCDLMLAVSQDEDTQWDIKETLETGKKGLSLSQNILRIFQSEPNRHFVPLDFVDQTGGKYASVKRILARLASTRKGAGPVRRIAPGMYQYDPLKKEDSLQVLFLSDEWKFENIRFTKSVSMGAQGGVLSLTEPVLETEMGTLSDSSQSVTHLNVPYPWKTPTGHLVTWEDYRTTGTQVISLCANGSPPLSPGEVLLIISKIRESGGLDNSWNCTSIEANIDSRYYRIDGSYSMQLIEGVLIKMYQHGDNARIEIADRRTVPLREIMNLFHSLANTFDGQGIIQQVKGIDERVTRCERKTSHTFSEIIKFQHKTIEAKPQAKTAETQVTPSFETGLDFKRRGTYNHQIRSGKKPRK